MSNERKSIEEMTADTEKPVRDRKNWVAFVESDAVNFMTLNEMEKMTLDDGSGNKANLSFCGPSKGARPQNHRLESRNANRWFCHCEKTGIRCAI